MVSRHRRSFLVKHKRATNHGKITPEMERHYSDLSLLLEEEDLLAAPESPHSRGSSHSYGATASITSTEGFNRRDSSLTQPDSINGSPKSRRSIFRRLIHH